MFCLICAWINGWVNNREAGDLRRLRAQYDVILMIWVEVDVEAAVAAYADDHDNAGANAAPVASADGDGDDGDNTPSQTKNGRVPHKTHGTKINLPFDSIWMVVLLSPPIHMKIIQLLASFLTQLAALQPIC